MTNLKRFSVKATAVLAMVTVLAASAVPAQANPNFSFSFNFGNNGGYNGGYVQPRPQVRHCMPNQRILRRLHNQGYTNVRFLNERRDGFPRFRARNGRWIYTLRVNRCNGVIRNVNRRPAPNFRNGPQYPHWNNNRPSFGITFNRN